MELHTIKENLKNKGFEVSVFNTGQEAVAYLEKAIIGKTVGIGGSLTVKELGLDRVLAKNNDLYWHWSQEQVQQMGGMDAVREQANHAQIYLCSLNGIAQTGELVNIDGSGNRISATAYGHEKVYFIVGKNKIEKDIEGAIWRARNVAAPKNAQRLQRKTPCAVKGDKCYNCNSPERICNGMLIIDRPLGGMKMEIVLIDEDLGM